MNSMKIVMIAIGIAIVVSIIPRSRPIALPLANNMDLRECESKNPGSFDISCDGISSMPLCGAGQRLSDQCARDASDMCSSCERGYFQPYHNNCSGCRRCTVCGIHQRIVQNCMADEDTQCEDDVKPVKIDPPDDPSSSTATAPPGTTTPSLSSTVDKTSVAELTTGITSITTPSRGYVSQEGKPGTVIALKVISVLAIIFALAFVIALVCCLYYKRKSYELRRLRGRDENDNQHEEELELGGQAADQNGYVCLQQILNEIDHNNRPPAHPPCPDDDLGQQCAQEPLYASVDKSNKSSKAMAADPERVKGVPLKSSDDPLQNPSSSSTRHSHRHPVCKALHKVFGRDGERREPAKKKQEPCSEVEKGALLSSHAGSSKCNSKSKSPTSPTMTLTIPPLSASSTATPSPSPPLPSPPPMLDRPAQLPSEEEPQLTVTSLPESSSSSSLPPTPLLSSSSSSSSSTSSTHPSPIPTQTLSSSSSSSPPHPPSSLPSPSQPPPPSSSQLIHPPPSSSSSSSSSSSPLFSLSSLHPPSSLPSPSQPPPPSSSPSASHLNIMNSSDQSRLQSGTKVKEDRMEEEGNEIEADGGAEVDEVAFKKGCGSRVTEDIERGAVGGAGSLPSVPPGAKPKVKQPNMKPPLIDPDEVVTEQFLDGVTDVVNIELVERISRQLGLRQIDIDNVKLSSSYPSPRAVGFKILLSVRDQEGRRLTYRHMLITMRDCGQKSAGDKLIAEFGINMILEKR